jgi:hypothetical protein
MTTGERSDSPLRQALIGLEVLIAYALVGLVAGLVWEALWTPPTMVVQQHQAFFADYQSLRRVFTGTGLYVIVGSVASALTALVISLLTRQRELLVLVAVTVGSALAAFVMWEVGVSRGPSDPKVLAKTAADGTHLSGTLHVSGHSPYLVWPMTALFVLALVFFAWQRRSATQRDDPARFDIDDPADTGVSEARPG